MSNVANSRLTAIDLFAGAGGLSLGLQRAGFDVVAAVENWDRAAASYRANFTHPVIEEPVESVTGNELLQKAGDLESVDLIAGGPPCQGFSIQRIGEDADKRNLLIFEFHRLVSEIQPRMFLMENVAGLLGRRGRPHFDRLLELFSVIGYDTKVQRVDAADFGVPQHRKRILLFGWQSARVSALPFTPASHPVRTVRDAIGDLPEPPQDHSPTPNDALHRRTKMSALNLERISRIPEGGGFEDLPVELRVNCHKAGAQKIGHRNVYGRLHYDKPSVTITARFDSFTRGKFGHPVKNRNISLREGARLQTFPDSFQFVGGQEDVAAQIGNAVPVKLAEEIGRMIKAHLSDLGSVPERQLGLFAGTR